MLDDLTDRLLPKQLVFFCVGSRKLIDLFLYRWPGEGRGIGVLSGLGKGRLTAHYDIVTAGDTACYGDDLL